MNVFLDQITPYSSWLYLRSWKYLIKIEWLFLSKLGAMTVFNMSRVVPFRAIYYFFFTHDVNAAMVYFCGLYKHHKGHPLCTKDKKRNLHKYFCGLYEHHKGHPLCTKDKKRNLHKYFCWEARQNDKWQIKKKDNKIRVHFFLSTCRVCVSLFIYKYI